MDSGINSTAVVTSQNQGDDAQKKLSVELVGSSRQPETENQLPQPQISIELQPAKPTNANLDRSNSNNCNNSNANENIDNVLLDMRNRCLDFELMGGYYNLNGWISTSALPQSNMEEAVRKNKQVILVKPGADTSICSLPTSMNDDVPNNTSSPKFAPTSQRSSHKSIASTSSLRGVDYVSDNVGQAPRNSVNKEVNPNSIKNKRRKVEHEAEHGGWKRCNCVKSKCLKLYCECFAAQRYCTESCTCQGCFNKPIYESTIRAAREQIEFRNPKAFTPKVIRSSSVASENGDKSENTPASNRHIKGCNCIKSSCSKKYCECYQGGAGCSISCRCLNCMNPFGRNGGGEVESDMKKETCKMNVLDNKEQILNSALQTTPLQTLRPFIQYPFSSKGKPPRPLSYLTQSSSNSHASQLRGEPDVPEPQKKLENQFETLPEDVLPNALHENHSSDNTVKTVSPNSKRIAPPNRDI